MTDALDGRMVERDLDRFTIRFAGVGVLATLALFVTGRWPNAAGVLGSLIPVGAIALRFRRLARSGALKRQPLGGISIGLVLTALPGVILIFVGNLVGGDFLILLGTACGCSIIGASSLLFALTRSMSSK